MADFRLTDEQRQLKELARDFAQSEIAPRAAHHDETGEFAMDIYRKAFEVGLFNVQIADAYGGLGLSVFDSCLIAEEMGAACTGISATMEASALAQAPVALAGSEEQKQEFLAPLCQELSFAALAAQEATPGLDPASLRTIARRSGDEYILSGSKPYVTNGGVARWYLVVALTDTQDKDRATSLFLVPKEADGVVVGPQERLVGKHASDCRAVSFDSVTIPLARRVGGEGEGQAILRASYARTLPLIAASAAGMAASALAHSVRYAKERTTFGQAIGNHQAVGALIADMAREIEASRLLAWQAAWSADNGAASCDRAVIARAYAVDTAMRVATDAVQVFGGYGYSREYPVEKLMRDAKVMQMFAGSSQSDRIELAIRLVGCRSS